MEKTDVPLYNKTIQEVSTTVTPRGKYVSSILAKINASLPFLDEETLKMASIMSVFFKFGFDFLNKSGSYFERSTNALVNELETLSNKSGLGHLRAQIEQLDSNWRDNMSKLLRLKAEWDGYYKTALQDYRRIPSTVRSKLSIMESRRAEFKRIVESKMRDVFDALSKFQYGTVKPISTFGGELSLGSVTWNIINYMSEIMKGDFLK